VTLEEALQKLHDRYELEECMTHDSLESLAVRARLKLVDDLRDLLSSPSEGEETK
jgi:hypothetical protein